MTAQIHPFKSRDSWLKLRSKNVSSTETAALFGLSPYLTELELFYTKQSGDVREIADNFRMRAGRLLEDGIAQLAGIELDCEVAPYKDYVCDPAERIGSSFDYVITSGQYKNWILEIKNVDFMVYRDKWQEDEAPDHIEVQVQHQMELTERPGTIIAALVGGNDLKLIYRERDTALGQAIRKRIAKFWADVEANNAPAPDYERDADFLIGLHQNAGSETLDAVSNDEINEMLHDYKRMKREAADLEALAKGIKARLFELVGDNVGKVLGNGITLSCTMTKDTPAKVMMITADMVGTTYNINNGRKGFRNFRVTVKK